MDLILWLFLPLFVVASQPPYPDPKPTIIDILSSQVQYSYFLRLLQRNSMIPIINSLENVTLFAPVNLAFAARGLHLGDEWINNTLLRYIVTLPVNITEIGRGETEFLPTLYNNGSYMLSLFHKEPQNQYVVENLAIIVEDVFSSHQGSYVHGIDQLLVEKPSMCEFLLASDTDTIEGESISLIKLLIKALFQRVTKEDKVDQKLLDLSKKFRLQENLEISTDPNYEWLDGSYFDWLDDDIPSNFNIQKKKKKKQRVIPKSCSDLMNNTKTMLLPTDKVLRNSLTSVQFDYYFSLLDDPKFEPSKRAIYDVKHEILSFLETLMISDLVGGKNGTSLVHESVNRAASYHFKVDKSNNTRLLLVNGVKSSLPNLLLEDGVFHIFTDDWNSKNKKSNFFSALGVPIASMNIEKTLTSLHYTQFGEELHFRKLTSLIDGSTTNTTLFLFLTDRDDVPDDDTLVALSFSSKQKLYYQFINEVLIFDKPTEKLADLRLCLKKRIGGCFKIKICTKRKAAGENEFLPTVINDSIHVISEPIFTEDGNVIYVLDKDLDAPSSLKHSLLDLLSNSAEVVKHAHEIDVDQQSCLQLFNFLNSFGLFNLPDNNKGYSLFLPCGVTHNSVGGLEPSPWDSLGLILSYLESHPHQFEYVLRNFIVQGLVYTDYNDSRTFKTIDKNEISIESLDKPNVVSINGTELALLPNSDVLFNQGVIHIVNKLFLPADMHISMNNLLDAVDGDSDRDRFTTFLQLLQHNSTLDIENSSFSFLVPLAGSLSSFNITKNYGKINDFINFHLIDSEEVPKILAVMHGEILNGTVINTNISDTSLLCIKDGSKTKLKLNSFHSTETSSYNKDHEVVILDYGCSTLGNHNCVFHIDLPLNLGWLEKPPGNFLRVYLGMVSVGVGVVFGLVLFGIVMLIVMMCLERSNKKKSDLMHNIFTTGEPSYMSVRSSEEVEEPEDYGYETDDDMLRFEHDQLLPPYAKRKRGLRQARSLENYDIGYGSIGVLGASVPTTPRPINGKTITNTLHRERNLPTS